MRSLTRLEHDEVRRNRLTSKIVLCLQKLERVLTAKPVSTFAERARVRGTILLAAMFAAASAAAQEPPARPGVDAPELAARGSCGAGVATLDLVQPAQLDPLQGTTTPERADRRLTVRVWYPASGGGAPVT